MCMEEKKRERDGRILNTAERTPLEKNGGGCGAGIAKIFEERSSGRTKKNRFRTEKKADKSRFGEDRSNGNGIMLGCRGNENRK